MKINKKKCCECGCQATWRNENANKGQGIYYCDECVPRHKPPYAIDDWDVPQGRKLMWWDYDAKGFDFYEDGSLERTENSFYFAFLDEKGRRYPKECFTYSREGFNRKANDIVAPLVFKDLVDAVYETEKTTLLTSRDMFKLRDLIEETYLGLVSNQRTCVSYNLAMSKIGDVITKLKQTPSFNNKQGELSRYLLLLKKNVKSKEKVAE